MADLSRWQLDFAPHLGFPTPEQPLFAELAGSSAPEAQIAFGAARGFRRVQDPFAAQRSVDKQAAIGCAAREAGLGMGCFVFAPMARAREPLWSVRGEPGLTVLDAEVESAIAVAERTGSRHIAVLTGSDPARAPGEQLKAMAENLAMMADRVAQAGMKLCIEAVDGHRLPHMLLQHYADAVAVVRDADHPAVRLIFDTAHVQAMDGDVLGNLDLAWDSIELIQLADYPNRVEPGAGTLDFEQIIDEIAARGFTGPVELEHGWAERSPEIQERYLRWLGRWSSQL